jgi:hypothetical protein
VNGGPRLALDQPRDASTLFRDALSVYGAHLLTFLAIGAAIVVPVQLVVSGFGLGQFDAPYDKSPAPAEAIIPTAVTYLVVAPLITAICIHALRSVAAGEGPAAGRAILEGFEAFTPLFAAVLLAGIGVAVGLILILPGIYLGIRWFFTPQAVVIDGERGLGALRRSGDLVQGSWWRTFAIVLVAQFPGILIGLPFGALAAGSDRQLFALVGEIVTQTVAAPFVAILATLLYYDLRARKGAVSGRSAL